MDKTGNESNKLPANGNVENNSFQPKRTKKVTGRGQPHRSGHPYAGTMPKVDAERRQRLDRRERHTKQHRTAMQ